MGKAVAEVKRENKRNRSNQQVVFLGEKKRRKQGSRISA
jgi:hypothetical protein